MRKKAYLWKKCLGKSMTWWVKLNIEGKTTIESYSQSSAPDIRLFTDQEGRQSWYDSILQAMGFKKAYYSNKRSIVGITNVFGTPVNPMKI